MATGTLTTLNNADPASSTLPLAIQHFWNLSPESQVAAIGAQRAPLYMMYSMGLGLPQIEAKDQKFIMLSEHPMIKDIYIKGATAAGANAALAVDTAYLVGKDITGDITDMNKILRPGDLIWVHPLQTNQTAAADTVAAAGETMKILSIAADGSFVNVERNIGSTANAANVTALSTKYLHAKLVSYARSEAGRSRDALMHALLEDYNYTQHFQEPYAVSEDAQDTQLAGGNPFFREQKQKLLSILDQIEETLLFGRRKLDVAGGDNTYYTGGFIPKIVGDAATYAAYVAANDLVTGNATSRVWRIGARDNFTMSNWLTMLARLYHEGSGDKVMLVGPGFYTTFLQTLENYITLPLTSNTGANIGFATDAWVHGFGSPLRVVIDHAFKGPRYNDAAIIDLEFTGMAGFGRQSGVHVWKGINGTGLQEGDSHTTKHAWEATVGANTSYALAHAYIQGMINDDGTYGGPDQTVGTLDPSDT